MFEKIVDDFEEWPEAWVKIKMFNSVTLTDVVRGMDVSARMGFLFTGADQDRWFRQAVVEYRNIPLLDGNTLNSNMEDPKLEFVLPGFMREVVVAAMRYSQLTEDDAKNS